MKTQAQPTETAYRTPECRSDEHGLCDGPKEIRLAWQRPTEVPVEVLRCDCGCHRR
ncbi:hypothetical protein ACH4SP_36970 [Streptomyces sp. NPDC021093]|uniref:hypothetical protein n=1 Tax=Streptomyces sp. NPDC021093 TaxID=3365112 RepID=UPI00378F15C1